MMQAQRSAKKTVSAMTVLVSRNDDDDEEEESRTGMVLSTAISGILLMNLAFTIWGFGEFGYNLGLKIKLF